MNFITDRKCYILDNVNNSYAAFFHSFLTGNLNLAKQALPRASQENELPPPLRISQRMKLEPSQLEGVEKRIEVPISHVLLFLFINRFYFIKKPTL